jgi:hypothetical protein
MDKSNPNRQARILPAKHPPSSVSTRRLNAAVKDVIRRSWSTDRKPGAADGPRSDGRK